MHFNYFELYLFTVNFSNHFEIIEGKTALTSCIETKRKYSRSDPDLHLGQTVYLIVSQMLIILKETKVGLDTALLCLSKLDIKRSKNNKNRIHRKIILVDNTSPHPFP